jgi:dihydrofolate reductase
VTRKITVNLYMTLDGYGEFPKYPGSDVATAEPSDAWKEMWSNRYDSVDTVIFGRRSFEGHQKVHSEVARKPDDPKYLFEYSRWLDRSQKIVLSHSIKKTDWQNSRIMSGDLNEIVARLKAEPGKDIIVDGGPSLVYEFIQRGLVDDYRMAVWPVILGRGNHYWGSMPNQQTMKLLTVRTLTYGRLFLH